jgi:hypothetical protein
MLYAGAAASTWLIAMPFDLDPLAQDYFTFLLFFFLKKKIKIKIREMVHTLISHNSPTS